VGATGTSHVQPDNIRRFTQANGELPAYVTQNGQHVIAVIDDDWWVFQRVGKFDTSRSAAKFADLLADEAVVKVEEV
jgi:hypothetical protein